MKNTIKLFISIILCLSVGFIGSLVTTPSISTWYLALQKPFIAPPNWVFAPVWTILFILMGVSLYSVWTKKTKINKNSAYLFFGIQLVLNFLWSYIFFGLHLPSIAFIEIIILWVFILLTILNFRKISQISANLLTPYILWVSFAAILNLSFVIVNL